MSRTLDFNDTASSVTAPSTIFNAAGSFNVYADDAAYVTAKGSVATEGDAYYNSTVDDLKYYSGTKWIRNESNLNNSAASDPLVTSDSDSGYTVLSLWLNTASGNLFRCVDSTVGAAVWTQMSASAELTTHESDTSTHGVTTVAGLTEEQTFTQKTLTSPVLNSPQVNTPSKIEFKEDTEANLITYAATTGHDGEACYATDTAKYYGIKADALVEFGAGGGGGLDVFHTNDFEDFLAENASGNDATFLGGGTIDGVVSIETTAPLSGDQSILYTAGTTSGSDYFEIETIDLDLKQRGTDIKLRLIADMSNFTADVDLVIWDKINGSLLTDSLDVLEGGASRNFYEYSCFVPATCTQISWGCHVNSGATDTEYFIIDDVEFSTSPWVYKNLCNTSDWEAYVPASSQGFGTLAATDLKQRRDGSNVEISGTITAGTVTATEARIALPTGLTSVSTLPTLSVVGVHANNLSAGYNGHILIEPSVSYITFGTEAASGGTGLLKANGISMIGNGNIISINASIPIQGWTAETEHAVTPAKAGSQIYNITQPGSSMTTRIPAEFDLATATIDDDYSGKQLISVANASSTTQFTSIGNNIFIVKAQLVNATGTNKTTVYKNGTLYRDGEQGVTSGFNAGVGLSIWMNDGDYLHFSIPDSGIIDNVSPNWVSIEARPKEATFLAAIPVQQTVYIKDVKAANTAGGTFTQDAWQTRTLNTIEYNGSSVTDSGSGAALGFVSIASNQITLGAGVYEVEGITPAEGVDANKPKLYNITTSADQIMGDSVISNSVDTVTTQAGIRGTLVLTNSTVFEVQHYCQTTGATVGFGRASNFSVSEVYTTVKITKVK